jgi:hypothetical protein
VGNKLFPLPFFITATAAATAALQHGLTNLNIIDERFSDQLDKQSIAGGKVILNGDAKNSLLR